MNHTNKYLRNFKQYKVASHKIWTVAPSERSKILKLDWNESVNPPTPLVKKRLLDLLNNDNFFNLYPSTYNDRLYNLLSRYAEVPVENVQYFGSSDSLHEYIAKLYISVGDPVVIIWPTYDNFRLTTEVNGGHVYYFNYSDEFTLDEQEFADYIESKDASLVYICNPNNPIGIVHSPKFIEKLAKRFPETMFLIDEAYIEFCDPKMTCAKIACRYENILVSRTMSKAFGIANFRFGYLIAHENNIRYISTVRNPKNITTFAQEAAIAVLEDVPYMKDYVSKVKEAKEYFYEQIKRHPEITAYPSSSNFILMKFPSFEEKIRVFDFLVTKDIFIRRVDQSPSLHCCLRISVGTIKEMKIVVQALDEYYAGKTESIDS